MNILFLDLETTGYAGDARCIEIAWILASHDKTIHREHSYLIKPDGWEMPVKDFWVNHGFSQQKSITSGTPITEVIPLMADAIFEADYIVAHNVAFDLRILQYEFFLQRMFIPETKPRFCTMRSSVNFCGLKDKNGKPKTPSMTELHQALFGTGFDGAHGAMTDTMALMRCFFKLVEIGELSINLRRL